MNRLNKNHSYVTKHPDAQIEFIKSKHADVMKMYSQVIAQAKKFLE